MSRIALLLLLAAATATAAPLATIERTVDVTAPAAWTVPLMHGESKRLKVALLDGRSPLVLPAGATAQYLWQTNGMDSAWWTAPAQLAGNQVAVDWTGEMDTGADRVTAFFAVFDSGSNRIYTAAGNLRLQPSPGYTPNEIPLPPRTLDFASVVVTNAPWLDAPQVDARIAAATNAIPQPDMSAYARLDGADFTGEVSVVGDLTIGDGGSESFVTVSPNSTLYITEDGGFQWGSFQLFRPARTGTLALLSDIPDIPASPSTYADPAPWSLTASPRATAAPTERENGDVVEKVSANNTILSYELGVAIEDRPEPYAYTAPEVEYAIEEDEAGCIEELDGALARASGVEGRAVISATATNGEAQSIALTFTRAAVTVVDAWAGDVETDPRTTNAWARFVWGTNFVAWIDAADTNALRSTAKPRRNDGGAGCPTNVPACLFPYAYDAGGYATNVNNSFFWPALAQSLLCVSAQVDDWSPVDIQTQCPIPYLAVSPHYAVTAAHWFYYGLKTPVRWCTSLAGAGTFVNRGNPQWLRGGGYARGDLRLVKFNVAIPTNLVCRLIERDELEKLSPTAFEHMIGFELNQHGYVSPTAVGPGGVYCGQSNPPMPTDWTAAGSEKAAALSHTIHGGDSGHVGFLVTPSAQLVPLFTHHSAGGGPDLTDPENIAWLKATIETLSGGTETITLWKANELK